MTDADYYYCSADKFVLDSRGSFVSCLASFGNGCDGCTNYHRKWLTDEQFKQEYGREWDGAVYILAKYADGSVLNLGVHESKNNSAVKFITRMHQNAEIIQVCACTPWGCPPAGWRP